ncbi:Serine-threonine/tyrosine-protein kinase catalytic domain [Arabidopsis thaliana x Arabidopsis arenosa]|uniref:Serine-threonine/tyrosine-protein kinase catalytic domain n=1 Tax=Arabidopsis thaliana x Arabidopsis arenosa TaxID=1240361 RepID=A0A8T1YD21_9BRAS|nr:Serine-threonine/tyrosine-protein kinase catalytic domain [Arabidopsis thaliana x Arabidopsis arenosa]
MICHALLVFSILLSAAVIGEGATAAYDPTEVFLFNCGDSSDKTDNIGRNWTAENRKILTSNSVNASFSSNALHQESGVPQVPYMKARIFQSTFTYSFPVSPGWKFLRLYFYPTRYVSGFNAVDSFFAVTVNGFTLLRNFSADLTVKASKGETLIKEFIVPVNQTLNLTFTPSSFNSFAFVNGIEIVSMPERFYSKGGFDEKIINVGSDVDFEIDNWTALETVHRLNVGGNMVNEVDDSGMFRRWLADDDYVYGVAGIEPYVANVKINYTEKTLAYVAPGDVYATCRTMGNFDAPNLNLKFNLTWLFTVDAEFNYLVRLHFCEILPEVDRWGQRVFSIFLGNQLAKRAMDVIWLSGGSRTPVYLDFRVYVGSESGPRPDLRLDLHPYKDIAPKHYDAILNGVEIFKLNNSQGNLAGPNPISTDSTPNSVTPPSEKGNKSHLLTISLAVVGSAIVLAMFVVFLVFIMKRKKKRNDFSVHTTSKPSTNSSWGPLLHGAGSTNTKSASSLPSDLCRRFSIHEIKSATNDFEEKLIVGVGGFGSVYKGRIDGGATIVAVKRLEITSNQGAKEFETELEMLSKLRHVHLVSLIGYCDDDNEMVLVYEYMPHGTLKDHLFKRDKASDPPLSWKRRLEICIGAARGLQYLHTGAKHTIIHRDIKTTNILLDENFVAKVSDFGLSRLGPTSASQTHVSTVVKGTFGYLDPEYYRRQILTEKSDVYSFGVVLLEVLCCRPIKMQSVPPEQADLIRWVKTNYKRGTVDQIIDSDLTDDITSTSMEKFCEIAVRCVLDRGIERPSMNDVVWALAFALQLHDTAKKNNDNVESLDVMPHGVVGTTTDGEDDLFSRTTGHVEESTTTDDSVPVVGDERSGSSWGVFSEINEPKAR